MINNEFVGLLWEEVIACHHSDGVFLLPHGTHWNQWLMCLQAVPVKRAKEEEEVEETLGSSTFKRRRIKKKCSRREVIVRVVLLCVVPFFFWDHLLLV